jgi:hypothetical protein
MLYATVFSNVACYTDAYSLQHNWQCAVSHIFNVCGDNVNYICSQTDKCSLDVVNADISKTFLHNLCKLHYRHPLLYHAQLYLYFGQSEALSCIDYAVPGQ